MRMPDVVHKYIDYYLEKFGVPDELFILTLSIASITYFVYDTKKLDKNEKFFKILFSSKYDEDFGGKIIGSFNYRHKQIVFVFSSLLCFIIGIILFLQYLINNYH